MADLLGVSLDTIRAHRISNSVPPPIEEVRGILTGPPGEEYFSPKQIEQLVTHIQENWEERPDRLSRKAAVLETIEGPDGEPLRRFTVRDWALETPYPKRGKGVLIIHCRRLVALAKDRHTVRTCDTAAVEFAVRSPFCRGWDC